MCDNVTLSVGQWRYNRRNPAPRDLSSVTCDMSHLELVVEDSEEKAWGTTLAVAYTSAKVDVERGRMWHGGTVAQR